MVLYHGTSTALPIGNMLLPPVETEVKREHWRQKDINVVFLAQTFGAAAAYAWKAVRKYGGLPVVLACKPLGLLARNHNGEYTAEKAAVISRQLIERKEDRKGDNNDSDKNQIS